MAYRCGWCSHFRCSYRSNHFTQPRYSVHGGTSRVYLQLVLFIALLVALLVNRGKNMWFLTTRQKPNFQTFSIFSLPQTRVLKLIFTYYWGGLSVINISKARWNRDVLKLSNCQLKNACMAYRWGCRSHFRCSYLSNHFTQRRYSVHGGTSRVCLQLILLIALLAALLVNRG